MPKCSATPRSAGRNYPRSFCNRGRLVAVSNYNDDYANRSVSRRSRMIGPLCAREQKYVIGCNTHITKPSARVPPAPCASATGHLVTPFNYRFRGFDFSARRSRGGLSLSLFLSRDPARDDPERESASGSASLLCRTLHSSGAFITAITRRHACASLKSRGS